MPRVRLALMMGLFYFALGTWAMTLPTFEMTIPAKGGLGFTTAQVAAISSAFAIGGLLAPLVIGLLADRLFHAERVLSVVSLLCALLATAVGAWCDSRMDLHAATFDTTEFANISRATFLPMLAGMIAFQFGAQLGLTLTTVIALRNLPDPDRFGHTRMWGTVGWVVAGNVVGLFLNAVSTQPFYLGSAALLVLSAYSLTLPTTPPAARSRTLAEAFGLPALALFRKRSFAVFVAATALGLCVQQFYSVYAHRYLTDLGRSPGQAAADLTLGQVCEIGCLLVIPLLNPRRRMKFLMLLGLGGWVIRAGVLAIGYLPAVVLIGLPLHGWSFAFFQLVGTVYLDREAPPDLRASAQGMLMFVSVGFGNLLGNAIAGEVVEAAREGLPAGITDWPRVWLVPLIGSAAAFLLFLVGFRTPTSTTPPTPIPNPSPIPGEEQA